MTWLDVGWHFDLVAFPLVAVVIGAVAAILHRFGISLLGDVDGDA